MEYQPPYAITNEMRTLVDEISTKQSRKTYVLSILALFYAYPKNVKVNLTEEEKKAFKAVAEQLKAIFREKDGKYYE